MNTLFKKSLALVLVVAFLILLGGLFQEWFARKNENAAMAPALPPKEIVVQRDSAQKIQSNDAATTAQSAEKTGENQIELGVMKKISILREILHSKNDNDPRLDSDFKELSAEEKRALQKEYQTIASEKRNERGTIVFLLGRESKSVEDQTFFKTVMQEKPCLSLADCSKMPEVGGKEAPHLESVDETTLYYPQIMALKMQEQIYIQANDPALRASAFNLIKDASHSSISRVVQVAQSILARIAP